MNIANIKTAVFPVAGLGTRFLPITKASPKEMLTIIDRPLIDYAVQEAIAAGVKQLVFVTSGTKRAIEDYFDTNHELELRLADKGKTSQLNLLRGLIPDDVSCVFIRQAQPRGLGDAILRVRDVVDGDPFAVLLADDFIMSAPTAQGAKPQLHADAKPHYVDDHALLAGRCLSEMIEDFSAHDKVAAMLGVTQITPSQTKDYGVVAPLEHATNKDCFAISSVVEKPKQADAPSNFGVVGRYILTEAVFSYLELQQTGAGGEIQLTDAIASLLPDQLVLAHPIRGQRYDCGSKLGYLEAVLAYANAHPEFSRSMQQLMRCYLSTAPA